MTETPNTITRHRHIRSALIASLVLAFAANASGTRAYGLPQDKSAPTQEPKPASSREAHTYRVIYSITESDSGKHLGVQHFQLTAVGNGPRATLKQGTKNPVLTGGYLHEAAPDTTQFQFTYLDVGLNLDALLTETNDGLRLTSKVEQLSIGDSVNPQMLRDPVVKQNVLECSSLVKPGVPVVLGSYDVPGSTRHFEIEVVLERVP